MARRKERAFIVLARIQKHEVTGDITLHLIRDDTTVELHEGDEFATVALAMDPWRT